MQRLQQLGEDLREQKLGQQMRFQNIGQQQQFEFPVQATREQQYFTIGDVQDDLEDIQLIKALAAQRAMQTLQVGNVYDVNPYMVQETLPGAVSAVQERLAMIPGADRSDSYMSLGYSNSPDSFSLGAQDEYLGCIGQPVLVYPE